ncbi:MAG TPA: lysylphosphatidylglycerol synthase transmembrane domain-containing protein [bacterium]|nr:lysylphosphatidylglycerol synthase transmembrane domain-containing protein [bacterium]
MREDGKLHIVNAGSYASSPIVKLVPYFGTAIILFLALRSTQVANVREVISKMDLRCFFLALAITATFVVLMDVEKWRRCLAVVGCNITLKQTVFIRLGSLPIKFIAPFNSGELTRVLYLSRRHNLAPEIGLASILYDKLLNFAAILFIIGIMNNYLVVPYIRWWICIIPLMILFTPARNAMSAMLKFAPERFRRPVKSALSFFDRISFLNTIFFFLISVIFELSIIMITWLILIGLDIKTVPLSVVCANVPLIELISSMPISLSGFGTREASFLVIFSSFASSSELFGAALLVTFVKQFFPVMLGLPLVRPFLRDLIASP